MRTKKELEDRRQRILNEISIANANLDLPLGYEFERNRELALIDSHLELYSKLDGGVEVLLKAYQDVRAELNDLQGRYLDQVRELDDLKQKNKDYVAANVRLDTLLKDKGYSHEYVQFIGRSNRKKKESDVDLKLKYSRNEIEEMVENRDKASMENEQFSREFVNYWMDVYRMILEDNLKMRDELKQRKELKLPAEGSINGMDGVIVSGLGKDLGSGKISWIEINGQKLVSEQPPMVDCSIEDLDTCRIENVGLHKELNKMRDRAESSEARVRKLENLIDKWPSKGSEDFKVDDGTMIDFKTTEPANTDHALKTKLQELIEHTRRLNVGLGLEFTVGATREIMQKNIDYAKEMVSKINVIKRGELPPMTKYVPERDVHGRDIHMLNAVINEMEKSIANQDKDIEALEADMIVLEKENEVLWQYYEHIEGDVEDHDDAIFHMIDGKIKQMMFDRIHKLEDRLKND